MNKERGTSHEITDCSVLSIGRIEFYCSCAGYGPLWILVALGSCYCCGVGTGGALWSAEPAGTVGNAVSDSGSDRAGLHAFRGRGVLSRVKDTDVAGPARRLSDLSDRGGGADGTGEGAEDDGHGAAGYRASADWVGRSAGAGVG